TDAPGSQAEVQIDYIHIAVRGDDRHRARSRRAGALGTDRNRAAERRPAIGRPCEVDEDRPRPLLGERRPAYVDASFELRGCPLVDCGPRLILDAADVRCATAGI